MFGALIPVVLDGFELAEQAVWRSSGVVMILVNSAGFAMVARWDRRVDFSNERWANAVLSVLASIAIAPLLTMAFGLLPGLSSGLFLTFMTAALGRAAFSFFLLLDTLLWNEFA